MKEFFEEFKYQCTSGKNKVFYCIVAFALVALIIGALVSLAMIIINLVAYKAFNFLWLALFLVALVITIAVIVWLKKS